MKIESTAELAREGIIGCGLAAVEAAAGGAGNGIDALAEVAAPVPLAFLFRLHLTRLLRRGPARDAQATEGREIHRLLTLAEGAAERGLVPLALPVELRGGLEDLEDRLVTTGFWAADAPLWWRPVPVKGTASRRWQEVEAAVNLPAAADLRDFADRPWRAWESMVPPKWVAGLHGEVEGSRDALGLEAGEVGRGHLDHRRSDRVRYLSGHEPELLERVPRLAALVQYLLARLPAALATVGDLATPQRAMLARYPAPSRGFDPHLDNPGDREGFSDNGRALTLVLYLNDPADPPSGGEIALWAPGGRDGAGAAEEVAPIRVQPAVGGSAILFDSRSVPHQVRPLAGGPARWALTVWLRDAADAPGWTPPLRRPTPSEIVAAVPEPPAPPGRVLLHRLEEASRGPRLEIESIPVAASSSGNRPLRCAVFTTVYDAGDELLPWARHHLASGFDHLLVVFDRPDERGEAELMERLSAEVPADRLTVWPAEEARRRWPERVARDRDDLHRFAALTGSASFAPHAHAARQALNATAGLVAARSGELGGAPLDWLLHLDVDERFHLEGSGRGGATAHEHFAALSAATEIAAGIDHVVYLNHELLHPHPPGGPARYKLNPRLAAARLGTAGWDALVGTLNLAQDAPRPWFAAYWNGKAAVRVDAARAAAGVHRWELNESAAGRRITLAGPVILHHHLPTAESFRRKYTRSLAAPDDPGRPFPPSPLEAAARRVLEAGGDLGALYERHTAFGADEIALLDEAGTIFAVSPG